MKFLIDFITFLKLVYDLAERIANNKRRLKKKRRNKKNPPSVNLPQKVVQNI